MIKIYLDDEREIPDSSWTRVHTATECIDYLKKMHESQTRVNVLSLDHDLGPPEAGTGYDVCCFLEEMAHCEPTFIMPDSIQIHSANPVGRQRMFSVVKRLKNL